ncbi:MAG: hypothetical protein ACFCU5_03480 [Pleurocapsa sp.]
MNHCLCCTDKLLRHIQGSETYWFCLQCRQKMPQTQKKYTKGVFNLGKDGKTATVAKAIPKKLSSKHEFNF